MSKEKNNIDHLNKIEIKYDPNKLVDKSTLNKYVLNGTAFKVKVLTTADGKNVIVNDDILKYLKDNNIKFNKLTYDMLMSYNFYKSSDYVFIIDLLKDAKGSIITYIEIIDESKKYSKEKELINTISTFGVNAVISSTKKKVIKYFKKKAPYIIRGYKFNSYDDDTLNLSRGEIKRIQNVKIPSGIKPDFIEYDINCLPNKKIESIPNISYLVDTDSKLNKASVYSFASIVKNNYMDREI